jgi:DNA-binding MarR family transcriptional regulator
MREHYYFELEFRKRKRSYTFRFDGGRITVEAYNEEEAKILAQAEAIKRGWDYEILTVMTTEELQELVDEKINEIFSAYQDSMTNPSGDITPLDALALEAIKNNLAELVLKVCNN